MHEASLIKMQAFLAIYANDARGKKVLDVGSRVEGEGKETYRESCVKHGLLYAGLDMQAGRNVDLVPANPYVWDEIGNEQFDYVISGQAFEHNPFPWVTFCEIARVLKPGGRAFIIAPSAGAVHQFPYDCWRYYPDSWAALCAVSGLELTESIREPDETAGIGGARWVDSAVVATKMRCMADFYANLEAIVAPFAKRRYPFEPAPVNDGKCFQAYMAACRRRKTNGLEKTPEQAARHERRAKRRAAATL